MEQVALDLFSQRGFDSVTVEEVCTEAGIAPATFYRYFRSKEDVFFGYELAFHDAVVECAEATDPAAAAHEQLLQFVQAFAEFLESQRATLAQRDGLVQQVASLRARTLLVQREWETTLAGALAVRRGRAQADDDDFLDASLCLDVLRGAMRAWRSNPEVALAAAAGVVMEQVRRRLV